MIPYIINNLGDKEHKPGDVLLAFQSVSEGFRTWRSGWTNLAAETGFPTRWEDEFDVVIWLDAGTGYLCVIWRANSGLLTSSVLVPFAADWSSPSMSALQEAVRQRWLHSEPERTTEDYVPGWDSEYDAKFFDTRTESLIIERLEEKQLSNISYFNMIWSVSYCTDQHDHPLVKEVRAFLHNFLRDDGWDDGRYFQVTHYQDRAYGDYTPDAPQRGGTYKGLPYMMAITADLCTAIQDVLLPALEVQA
jgi:hypothetical protein